jgi:hypothetical protein
MAKDKKAIPELVFRSSDSLIEIGSGRVEILGGHLG